MPHSLLILQFRNTRQYPLNYFLQYRLFGYMYFGVEFDETLDESIVGEFADALHEGVEGVDCVVTDGGVGDSFEGKLEAV